MIVNFEGEQHNFPDDAGEDEIRSALGKLPAKPPKEDVTAGMALRGVPVLGAYVPQAEAAIRAAAQPLTGVGKPGATWSERYAANLPERERQYHMAEEESPITSEALKIGGGMAALAPLGATAAGGRALGLTGSIPARLTAGAASGAGLSAADVAARGGSAEDIQSAAKWGGGIGAAAPVVAGTISKAISPFVSSEPTRRGLVQTLRREGVEPTAGEVTGSKPLQWAEQHLGELAGVNAAERTAERFTGAALRRTGENATRATPEVVDRAFTRIGQQFDDLAARNVLQPDRGMGANIRQAVAEYDRMIAPPNRSPALAQYEQEIANALASNRNTIPGDIYQSLRSRIEADARGTNDRFLAGALRDIRGALDDAIERHLQRIGSSDAGAWRQARNQYRNLLVIERAITSPGANAQLGLISPAALYNATRNVQGRRNLARGVGDFADLAQAGSALLRPLPSSGTAQRGYYAAIPGLLGAAAGGVMGGDLQSALTGAAAGFGPPLMGRAIMSPLMQRYLANQAMAGRSGQALRGGVTGGLLSMMR
jgi:hypothetical protein